MRGADFQVERAALVPESATGRGKAWRRGLIDTPEGPMTRKEAVERSGLPLGTIARRIWAGWPPERLFDPAARHQYRLRKPGGARPARLFTTPYGQLTLAGIAAIVGIAPKAMQMRLTTYRWSQEEAFNTPRHAARGTHPILPATEYRRRVAAIPHGV